MDAFTQMELHKAELTPREREIYELFRNHPEAVTGSTSTAISERFNIPQSAVSRFCKKIGFSGYGDFRMNMVLVSNARHLTSDDEGAIDISDVISNSMHEVRAMATDAVLDNLSTKILKASRTYTVGEASSGFPAHFLAFLLIELSLPGQFINTGWEEEMLHCTSKDDLVIIFSSKNPTQRRFLTTMREMNRNRQPHVVLVTQASNHPLRSLVDDVLLLPAPHYRNSNHVMDGASAMLFFCQFMYDNLARATASVDE